MAIRSRRHTQRTGGTREGILAIATLATTVLLGLAVPTQAQPAYPERPIRLVIPLGAGGIGDLASRVLAEGLSKRLGQPVVVENKPGGAGIPAAREVLNAAPDGHSLAMLSNGTAISVTLAKNFYDPVKAFAPVSNLAYFDFLLAVNAASPYKTPADIVAAARAKPGTLNGGSAAHGTTGNLVAELFKQTTGADLTIVTYRNAADRTLALLRNDIAVLFDTYTVFKPQLDSGQFRAIASTTTRRTPWLPDVPTAMETGIKDFEVTSWNAVFVRAGTPPAIVARLNKEINAVLGDPAVVARLRSVGLDAKGSTPAELGARLKADIDKWAKVIKAAKIVAK
jgi:tripartite-type tricarboxylate transporter receptor subunit TctC